MAGELIGAGRNYCIYSEVMDYKMYRETRVLEGETADDATLRLFREMDALAFRIREEAESVRGVHIVTTPVGVYDGVYSVTSKEVKGEIPSINKQYEQAEIDFDNAGSIEELKSAKEKYPILPGKLLYQYNKRLKELTNGTV